MDSYLEGLLVTFPLREPVIKSAIQALNLPSGSSGLDAGCGLGQPALLLAEQVGPAGHVTGVDVSATFLNHARKTAAEKNKSKQVSFQQADVTKLPFETDQFDWAWSMDCIGYHPADPRPALEELKRVVKPGGSLVLVAWSSQQLLPGYPRLEARLNATAAGTAPFTAGTNPGRHFLRTKGWFQELGLRDISAGTFAGNVMAPLSDELKAGLISLLSMRWGGARSETPSEEWEEYERITQPGSPDFILARPDYYAFFTYSMFRGVVGG
jgi:demethylmenaquinone methyltransferase/2-methoxy-6-polyprenyl-1,4-benzoquinol methylase